MTQRLTPAALARILRTAQREGAQSVVVRQTAHGVEVEAHFAAEQALEQPAAALDAWRRKVTIR